MIKSNKQTFNTGLTPLVVLLVIALIVAAAAAGSYYLLRDSSGGVGSGIRDYITRTTSRSQVPTATVSNSDDLDVIEEELDSVLLDSPEADFSELDNSASSL